MDHIAKPIAWCHVVSEVDTPACQFYPTCRDGSQPQKQTHRPDHITGLAKPRSAG
ncbi:hypothetical protein GBA52_008167 [Prunus armeniaca]|nr:hypothetical protein GBA52_008167 [Prunus armeniaca]